MSKRFSRILLKLSGEILREGQDAFHGAHLAAVAQSIAAVRATGIEVAVVVGGGNLLRGRDHSDGRVQADVDQIGMLATVLNVGMLRFALEEAGLKARIYSPRAIEPLSAAFNRRVAMADLADGVVVLLGGGTGNPFFSTDSAAALRAIELQCDAVLKGTMVDGVYDKDPHEHQDAQRFDRLSFDEVLRRDLRVMDQTAFALCRDHSMPVVVFDYRQPENFLALVEGRISGTVVSAEEQEARTPKG
jgi:uridylate kinase